MARPNLLHLAVPFAILFATAGTTSVAAQTLEGVLVDEGTLDGIEGATIALLSSSRATLATTLTDSVGEFRVEVPGFGAYFIRAEHLGYGSVSTPSFNITGTEADTVTLTFYVTPQAIALDPILVGIPSVLGVDLFEERRTTGTGVFFTPEMIDSIRPTEHVGEIFRHAEDDIFLTWGWGLREGDGYGPIPSIRAYRGTGCLNYIVDRTPVPEPFYDGVSSVWGVAPLRTLKPEDLVAIEIYRGWWEVPKDYEDQILANTLGTRRKLRDMRLGECGVVVIWTDEGWGAQRSGSSN
jgi:Carboxypeptidase regulatory-like domain